jgi:signal transduction histidine kinase
MQQRRGPWTEGSRLRLAIVKTIEAAHGGTATVNSRPGEVARVEITAGRV